MVDKIKVAIADDEQMICVIEESLIQWDELDLELVGIAHDGIELSQLIIDKDPDIVITDICMPEMSGLDLIKQVRHNKNDIKFIIISGYKQFEYAQDALKYRVDDYLLKPINGQELNDALLKLKTEIQNDNSATVNNIFSIEESTKNREKIRRIFLKQLLQNPIDFKPNYIDIKENYGISFHKANFQAIYAKLDTGNETPEKYEGLISLSSKIIRIFDSIFQPVCHETLSFAENGKIFFVINYDEVNQKKIQDGFDELFVHAKNIVDLFGSVTLTLGIGNVYSDISDVTDSITDATEAIYNRIVLGTNKIIYSTSLSKTEGSLLESDFESFDKQFSIAFEALDSDAFLSCIDDLFSNFSDTSNIYLLVKYCLNIGTAFFQKQNELHNEIPNEEYKKKRIYQEITNATKLSTLKHYINKEITSAINQINEEKKAQSKKPIKKALMYIEENYDKQISLGDVAEAVWLNPVYFSNLFKKEMGENFVDYLHKYRINIAKDLLRTSNENINYICYVTGYDDPNYFVKLFKKYVGLTPSEFRKIYG